MTLVMFEQQDDWALIVTDSLAVSETTAPMFQTKARTVPHLNLAMVAHGSSNLMTAWHHHVLTAPGLRDIEDVNAMAPSTLKSIEGALTKQLGDLGKTRIFIFGFPAGSGQLVRYTYKSDEAYASDRFEGPSWWAAPPPVSALKSMPETPEEYIALAAQIRDESDVAIGGELFATQLYDGSVRTDRWHRFPDYDEIVAGMQQN
jgi:hypothetical protein